MVLLYKNSTPKLRNASALGDGLCDLGDTCFSCSVGMHASQFATWCTRLKIWSHLLYPYAGVHTHIHQTHRSLLFVSSELYQLHGTAKQTQSDLSKKVLYWKVQEQDELQTSIYSLKKYSLTDSPSSESSLLVGRLSTSSSRGLPGALNSRVFVSIPMGKSMWLCITVTNKRLLHLDISCKQNALPKLKFSV